jgi:transposase
VNGRKRHIVVDTLGLLLTVVVTAASVQDRDGAMALLEVLRHRFARLRVLWADQAYAGDLLAWVWALRPWRKVRLDLVIRPEGIKGFLLLPKRWVVEISQLSYFYPDKRRLSDYCPNRIVAARDHRGQGLASSRRRGRRARERMSPRVLPARP